MAEGVERVIGGGCGTVVEWCRYGGVLVFRSDNCIGRKMVVGWQIVEAYGCGEIN